MRLFEAEEEAFNSALPQCEARELAIIFNYNLTEAVRETVDNWFKHSTRITVQWQDSSGNMRCSAIWILIAGYLLRAVEGWQ